MGTDENVDDFYSNAAIIIPVVVHVVYNPNHPEQNITDAQIHSQIRVLNEDFERGNTDAINTPNDFLGKAADTRIRFTLAQSDPNCNPTNGIVRIATSVNTDIAPFDLVI